MGPTVIGSSLAALVAVAKISEVENVTWVQTSKRIGGHFSGISLDGHIKDAGMVLLEPFEDFDGLVPDFAIYGKESRHDVRSVIPFAFDWLRSRGIDFTPANVFTSYNERLIEDFYIKDSLNLIRCLPLDVRQKISQEIVELDAIRLSPIHPREKLKNSAFENMTFEEAVIKTIGPTYLREVISPWANSFASGRALEVVAIEHRSMWLPMYFPESILNALNDETNDFEKSEKKFAVPLGISVGTAIVQLSTRVSENSRVNIIDSKEYEFTKDQNPVIFLGSVDDAVLMQLANTELSNVDESRTDIAVALFEASGLDAGPLNDCTVNVYNSPNSLYRFSIRKIAAPSEHMEFVFEFGNSAEVDDAELERISIEQIMPFYESPITLKKIVRAKFSITSPEILAASQDLINAIDSELASQGIMGFTVGPYNSAFNDQLCQGIICAENSRKGSQDAK